MLKNYLHVKLLLLILAVVPVCQAQDLVHYWNFNDNSSLESITAPTFSAVSGASITPSVNGSTVVDLAGGTGQDFDVENLNARNGDPSGTHFRFNNPIGSSITFALPTTGFGSVVVKFATRRSGSGAGNQVWSYSIDGTNFIVWTVVAPVDDNPTLQSLDFSLITAADNNPNFKLRVEFEQGSGGTGGNNRFDNFTLDGTPLGGDTTPPTVTIAPTGINVPADTDITLTFNEAVRLADDSAIDDTNVDALVELRLDDLSGTLIPFDATFTGNVITINPAAALDNGQSYEVRLLANVVEDLSDNVIATMQSAGFTVVASQPALAAGDLVIVAYRMSATGTEDQVAILTLANMPTGTNLNLTDGKYTTNAQPQCDGGIVWTSNQCIPAGTVFTIQTDALLSDKGLVTGEGFGLSSNGDQVIIYTGPATAPNYLTAMSSNGWVSANTDCGGSLSLIPSGLADGISALNTATAPGNVGGNSANAFYNGTQTGTDAALRTAILDPANWVVSASNTAPQAWPTWDFPTALQVETVSVTGSTTIEIVFSENVDQISAMLVNNYNGIPNLGIVDVAGNVVTLNYTEPFGDEMYTLTISGVEDFDNEAMPCAFSFEFDGSLGIPSHSVTGFALYPNPTDNGIVNLPVATAVKVFDLTGKLVYSAAETQSIDTASFTPGIYIVKTADGTGRKLVVR
jgi:hypothetical protein